MSKAEKLIERQLAEMTSDPHVAMAADILMNKAHVALTLVEQELLSVSPMTPKARELLRKANAINKSIGELYGHCARY